MQQQCHISGETAEAAEMLRFVRAPDGTLTPDLAGKLPGETLWVACRPDILAKLETEDKTHIGLPHLVEGLLRTRMRGALGLAKKAGAMVTGFTKVEAALLRGELALLLAACDGAQDGRQKLANRAAREGVPQSAVLTCDELGMALGRANVIHAGATDAGWAARILTEDKRLTAFQSGPDGVDRSESA